MATKAKAKKKAKKKPIKVDFFKDVYRAQGPQIHLNNQEFRFTAIRKDYGNISLDPVVETCEWRDEGSETGDVNTIPILRGSISLRKPAEGSPGGRLNLKEGHVVKCDVKWGGRWVELWRMRLQKPNLAYADGGWTFEMADDLLLASASRADFKFKKGKKRKKKGWYYHEIVREICRQYRIPMLRLARGKERITNFVLNDVSPLEAIRKAVALEVQATGRRLVIVWRYDAKKRKSGLDVVPMRRNKLLYQFKDQIRNATFTHEGRATRATALIVRGVVRKNKKAKRKKVRMKVVNKAAVKRYGYIQRDWQMKGTVESKAVLRRKARHELRDRLELKQSVTDVSHSGIAFLRRGDAVRLTVPEEGYKGKKSIVFVASVAHSVTGGDYTMDPVFTIVDPMDPNKIRAEREAAMRAKKRKKKAKKKEKK